MDFIPHIVTGVLVLAFIVVAYLSIRSRRKLMKSSEELARADERFGDSLEQLTNKTEGLDLGKIDEELNPGNGFKELTNKVERPDLGKIKEEVKN